jgi:hypothetical protein
VRSEAVAGSGEGGDLTLCSRTSAVRVGVSYRRIVDDDGTGDDGSRGEHGEGAFSEQADPETAAGCEFADVLGDDALAGTGYPGDERRRSDGGDRGAQGGAGAVEEAPHGSVTDAQRSGHLLVAVPGKCGAKDDLALHVRKGSHVGEGLAQVQAAGEVGLEDDGSLGTGDAVEVKRKAAAVASTVASQIDGGVVGDAIEPRAELAHRSATAQCGPGLKERLLDDIFGAAVGDGNTPAVAQEGPTVALNEGLEGAVVAGAGHRRESLVGLRGQQAGGCLGTHGGASPMLERRTRKAATGARRQLSDRRGRWHRHAGERSMDEKAR